MEDDNKKNSGGSGRHGHSQRPIDDVSEETYSWWKKNYVLIKKTRIRTWKGVFLLAFIIGAAVALIWTISTNIHQFLKAEGETATMAIAIKDEVTPILVGDEFAVDITLDTASNIVAARAIVNYDPADLQLVGCSTDAESTAFVATAESCLETLAESFRIVDNNTPGVFDITLAKPNPGVTGDTGIMVATLTFKALRVAASSSLSLTFDHQSGVENYVDSDVILNDSKGTDILISTTPATFAIGSAICNEWVPSSDWGVCQSGNMFEGFDGYHTRTIRALPENCVGGVPTISTVEGCDYEPPVNPVCNPSSYAYSDWSECQVTNTRTRTITASAPSGCDQSNAEPTLESCQYIDPDDGDPTNGEDIDIDAPKIKVSGGDRVKLKKDKKFYSKERKFSFKGKISGLEGGSVKAYVDGDLDEEIKLNSKGEWKYSKKGKEGKTYKIKFAYFNSKGQEVDDSSKYEVKVDTKKPKFTDLPLALNKTAGAKIWWKAEDNNKIDHFRIEFNGRKKEIKSYSFIVPANTPRGMHWLVVKAYDKAGNTATRRVLVRVR